MKNTITCIAILAFVIVPISSVPYSVFKDKQKECLNNKDHDVGTLCSYEIFNNKGATNSECAQDYYRSYICETTFDDCYNLKDTDQYPYICYLCWVDNQASTTLYQSFQKCLEKTVYESNLSFVLVILAFIAFML